MKLNYKITIKIIGLITLAGGIAMIPSIIACFHYHESYTTKVFVGTSISLILIGALMFLLFRNFKTQLKITEGYFIALLSWIYASFIGTLPFVFSGYPIVASIFESVAGFTTTGCSVLDISMLPRSLILWRSILNLLGGMGILVLVVSVFPALGISGQSIASAETTGPTLQKIGAKFSDTSRFLYITYFTFTIFEFVLLLAISPLGFFDSLVNTFSTVSTGGIYIRLGSEALFDAHSTRIIIMIFTILSSLNYTLYYLILSGRWKMAIKNVELRVFLIIIFVSTILISISLRISGEYNNIFKALEDSMFQVVSFISTSGYFVCDYNSWPSFAIITLFFLLLIGGCSMSTSGSLKVVRIITLFKLIKRGIFIQIHPNATKAVVIDKKAMPSDQVSSIISHIVLYFVVLIISFLLLSFNGLPLDQTLTATLGMFTNTGVMLGPEEITGVFSIFNQFSQLVMCVLMIAGRLEMYSLILVFTKSFWSKDSANAI